MITCVVASTDDEITASAFRFAVRSQGLPARVVAVGADVPATGDLEAGADVRVTVGDASPVLRTGLAMIGVEREFVAEAPSHVVVFGADDVALAAALVAAKIGVPVWMTSAGSWGWTAKPGVSTMKPSHDEQMIGSLAAGFFAPSPVAANALKATGIDPKKIFVAGPLEAEALERCRHKVLSRAAWSARGLSPGRYVAVSSRQPVAAPGAYASVDVRQEQYLDRLSLVAGAAAVVTDSINLQIEACLLRVPCLVLAPGVPLPESRAAGAAWVAPSSTSSLAAAVAEHALNRDWAAPGLFDACVSDRMIDAMGLSRDATTRSAIWAPSDPA